MKRIKLFLAENRKLSYTFLFAWLTACVFAAYYGARATGEDFTGVCEYVKSSVESKAEFGTIIKNGMFTNIKFMISVLVVSLSTFLCPFAVLLAGIKGFSCGITSVILFEIYGIKAIAIVLSAIVIPQLLNLPIYMTMLILSVKYPFSCIKSDKTITVSDRRKQWFSYVLLQLILTAVLMLITIIESLIIKLI